MDIEQVKCETADLVAESVDDSYVDTGIRYDVVGKIVENTVLKRMTVKDILSGILPASGTTPKSSLYRSGKRA